MRKELKKKKAIKLKNKRLLKKYPWLMPKNVWTGKEMDDYDYSWTLLDEIPRGWKKCFGLMMVKEMDVARNNTDIFTYQIKEKFGELRWYVSANKEVNNIINKYSIISRNVCMKCGKPDVYMTDTGWIFPCCQRCWENNKYNIVAYKDIISGENTIPNSYKVTRFSKDGNITEEIDISDTVEKIRKRCSKWISYPQIGD